MFGLNEDALFLILEELKYDSYSLYSCLLVNKNWCKIVIPILWKNPWKYLKKRKKSSLFDIIILHLSNETKKNLGDKGIIHLPTEKPIFNYISFMYNI